MKAFSSAIFICLLFVVQGLAQSPAPTPPPEADGDIVKITTTLIQVDVSVRDKDGKQVIDLQPEDFEILENGKPRKITNFSYVAVSPDTKAAAENGKRVKPDPKNILPPVIVKLRPENVRRTIVLVVDDLSLSFGNVFFVREALKKFVAEQMQPNDLVAIVRTGSGSGTLQQFTSDRRILYAAISKIKFNPNGNGEVGTDQAIRPSTKDLVNGMRRPTGGTMNVPGNSDDKKAENTARDQRNEQFTVGTLGTLRYLISGMNTLPGRKAIVFLSDGFPVYGDLLPAFRNLVDLAIRSGVVINTIDARGVRLSGSPEAMDDLAGMDIMALENIESARTKAFEESQGGLDYLAKATGGRSFKQNNISAEIGKAVNDQNGYYLIGYMPDEDTFDPKVSKFNRIVIRVKRPDVRVSYRSGFFGVTDEAARAATETPQTQLRSALTSPFGSKDIDTRLTSIFENDAEGSHTRALLYIDANNLQFADDAPGSKKIKLEIYAYLFGADGSVAGNFSKGYNLTVKDESVQRLKEKGLLYSMNVPVKKPGAYQLRIAVRDLNAGKIGSANQFIEIPDLKKDHLTLSGLVLQNMTPAQLQAKVNGSPAGAEGIPDAQTTTAIRTFKRETILFYSYSVYNAKNPSSGGAQLISQTRLYRDGQLVLEGKPTPLDTAGGAGPLSVEAQGAMMLGKDLVPGDYVLQIVTTDSLANPKEKPATQWIDFEIIE